MKLSDPTSILGPQEKSIIDEASRFLSTGIPIAEIAAERASYLSEVMKHKELIVNLKSLVDLSSTEAKSQVCQVEQSTLESLSDEYPRATDRNRALWSDSKFMDVRRKYDSLKALSNRLESIKWSLSNAYNAMSR